MNIEFKRGDTLSFIVTMKDENDIAMTGLTLQSQIRRTSGQLVDTFIITETATTGDYSFVVPASRTKLFPIAGLVFDIEWTQGDIVQSSETYTITVLKDITCDSD